MNALKKLLNDEIRLPSPPAIAVRILEAVKQDTSSFVELAEIISSDPALSAKILKVANSSFYARQKEIDSIKKALSLLGVNALKNIALSFVIADNMRRSQKGQSDFDFDFFWKKSVTAAVAAELLASRTTDRNDDAFVTALLHNIGVLVIYFCRETDYLKVLDEKRANREPLAIIEQKILGFNHQEVGAEILADWGLPPNIYQPIRYHHDHATAPDEYKTQALILKIAGEVSAIYHGPDKNEKNMAASQLLATEFNFDDQSSKDYIDSVAERSIEILSSFEIETGDLKPFSQILQEANEELGKLNLSYEQLVLQLKQEKARAEELAQQLRHANSRLREMATRDELTGLYNYRFFRESLERKYGEAIRYGKQFALIMFDIDHFKTINDTHGHLQGDIVLKEICRLVIPQIRDADILARYGGEEFMIILPDTDIENAATLAERLRRIIAEADFKIEPGPIKTTISLGVTSFIPDQSPHDKSILITAVDQALYKAKDNGRNRVETMATASLCIGS